MRIAPAGLAAAVLLAFAPAGAVPSSPLTQNPLGPLRDVTAAWQRYQPATEFCVKPNVYEFSNDVTFSGDADSVTGADRVCRRSGFRRTDTGLHKVRIRTPLLCAGCRRLFLDYARIPHANAAPNFYAHGHAYFHLQSFNPSYTADPLAHSPNIKNLTNDKLVAPAGSTQEQFFHGFDLHAISYTGDTANVAHSPSQGPYYAGPRYLSRSGRWITGAYVDVDAAGGQALPNDTLNDIGYSAGFNSGEATCPDNVVQNGQYRDGNYYYGGCVDHFGGSAGTVNPYA